MFDDLGIDYTTDYTSLPKVDKGIVLIPARHHAGLEGQVNKQLANIKQVQLYLIGDEESVFDVTKISHPDIQITVQNPRPKIHDDYYKIGTGYPTHFLNDIPRLPPSKDLDYFFAGQTTAHNPNRVKMISAISSNQLNSQVVITDGFGQGLAHQDYYAGMARSKVALCPSGPELPDTFRLFEALELGCLPIVDEVSRKQRFDGYWEWFFNEQPPFTIIKNYPDINGYINNNVKQYPEQNNKVQAWWYRQKWAVKDRLVKQDVTVVVPVSPIKSHPSTAIIDETLASIKYHLPHAKIIVSFDGVRDEQSHLSDKYHEHIRAVLYKHRSIYPVIFAEHRHQSGMMRYLLDNIIDTPYLMYVEQDTPLEKTSLELGSTIDLIGKGHSNLVRFHHETVIPDPHKHMMFNKVGNYTQTAQWSQRPHLASTAFYKRVMAQFSEDSKCFIEDLMHGVVWNAYVTDGKLGYNQWRLHIYTPEGNIKRSYHLDGREGATKYDSTQTF